MAMFRLEMWFGSPFAGHVCDDGPTYESTHPTFEAALALVERQRAVGPGPTEVRPGIWRGGFRNLNGSPTGGYEIRRID
jgi:hypothetical protein